MNSNGAMRLVRLQPHEAPDGARLPRDAAGIRTWEIRSRIGECLLSLRSTKVLAIGDDDPSSIQRLLAALHARDRERWDDAVAEVLDPEGTGECSLDFGTLDAVAGWLAVSGKAFFDGMCAMRVGAHHDIAEQLGGRS